MHATSDIVFRDRNDETEVGVDELILRFFIAGGDALRQLGFFFGGEKRDLADLLQVHLHRIVDFDFSGRDLREFLDRSHFFLLGVRDLVFGFDFVFNHFFFGFGDFGFVDLDVVDVIGLIFIGNDVDLVVLKIGDQFFELFIGEIKMARGVHDVALIDIAGLFAFFKEANLDRVKPLDFAFPFFFVRAGFFGA
ncbi:MAG: hypothetical protein BWY98_00771 [Tenericutes bacterium ADurb.BinA155]|nr:MAG: hypothetical protein BWY98_00771 [Tenericutes bacterium ADurb.BinA155]